MLGEGKRFAVPAMFPVGHRDQQEQKQAEEKRDGHPTASPADSQGKSALYLIVYSLPTTNQ